MSNKLYGLIQDSGDGSSCLQWFADEAIADKLLSGDDYCETFGVNEGSPAVVLIVPEGLTYIDLGIDYLSDSDFSE